VTETAEQRKAELLAELEQVEREQREQERQREEQERREAEATVDPKQKAIREEIELRAREALDREWPPSWSPQKPNSRDPDELVGLVTRIDPRVGPSKTFGTFSAVLEVKATDGREWTVWCNEGGALYAQLLRLRIQPGDVIAIRYRGLKNSEANPGQQYQDFRLVRVEEDEGEPQRVDYDALQRSQDEPAALPPPEEAPPDDDIPF
jgi:hypothetical protein